MIREKNDAVLQEKINTAIWIGKALFDRGLVTGSTSNMSFLHKGKMFITASGSCFGRLSDKNFAEVDLDGSWKSVKPSKEFPIHLALYQANPANQAVIHTHSLHSTMWSCLKDVDEKLDTIAAYTPYLRMLSNQLVTVPYAPPGTQELFSAFKERAGDGRAYLLKNHGPVVSGKNLMDALYLIEELEVSAKISWMLRDEDHAVPYEKR